MPISFAKYEGAGNDFVLIDNRTGSFEPTPQAVARLCDRHFGIGADGLMTLTCNEAGTCIMHYYNADGSAGEMCGNGARCFALFVRHLGLCEETCRFEATDGPHEAQLRNVKGPTGEIEVEMIPVSEIRQIGEGWYLNTGVPHYVEFVEYVNAVDVCGRGRKIRYDAEHFPQGTNVDFVEIRGDGKLKIRTYERGVENETLACGTGATAAALIANFARQQDIHKFDIDVHGGRLNVRFHRDGAQQYNGIYLTGPSRRIFRGTIE